MRPHYVAPALLVSFCFCATASAESTQYATVVAEPDVPTKIVNFSDLNLQRDAGVATLYRRIQGAANAVCRQVNESLPQIKRRARECALDATSRAVAKVGVPALSTMHLARTQKTQSEKVMVAKGSR